MRATITMGGFILRWNMKNTVKPTWKIIHDDFKKLPPRCLEAFFEFLEEKCQDDPKENAYFYFSIANLYDPECKSPIEQIFNFAYSVLTRTSRKYLDLCLIPQYEIKCFGKKYIADFVFDSREVCTPWLDIVNEYKLVIECDGHDFHEKTKEQVIHDNERDYDLKSAGYDILHFSGSEIYNDPFKCAWKVLKYISKNVKVRVD